MIILINLKVFVEVRVVKGLSVSIKEPSFKLEGIKVDLNGNYNVSEFTGL